MIADWSVTQWFPYFANLVVQSTVVLIGCVVVLMGMRKQSAAHRHLVATGSLLVLLLLPVCSLISFSSSSSRPVRSESAHVSLPIPAVERGARVRRQDNAPFSPGRAIASRGSRTAISAGRVHVVSETEAIQSTVARSAWGRLVCECVFIIWLVGCVIGLIRLGVSLLRLICLKRVGLDAGLQSAVEMVYPAVGYHMGLRIYQCPAESFVAPGNWGIRAPVVLLPASASGWSESRLRAIVLHEIAHVRRADWVSQAVATVVCIMYWFHPLAWYCYRRMQIEAECACDDAVLMAGISSSEYANHLLDMVKTLQSLRRAPIGAVGGVCRSQVGERVEAILGHARKRSAVTRFGLLLAFPVCTVVLLLIMCLRPLNAKAIRQKAAPQAGILPRAAPLPEGPSGTVVTLDNGVGVELIGVGSSRDGVTASAEDWWRPDGTRMLVPPVQGHNRFHRSYPYCGPGARALFFRLHSTGEVAASTTGYVVDPTHHLDTDAWRHATDIRLNDTRIWPQLPATGSLLLPFPVSEKRCTYRFGIATGEWRSVSITPVLIQTAGGAQIALTSRPVLSFSDRAGKAHQLSLLGANASLGDVARRIVALDAAGDPVPLDEAGLDSSGEASVRASASAMKRIVAFRLETRSYQWVEFPNIVLAVQGERVVAGVPERLPRFRHTFSCGVTVSIPCITERRADGGRWWQPDGKRLSGPVLEAVDAADFQGIRQGLSPRAVMIQEVCPREVSYSQAWQILLPSQTEGGLNPFSNESTLEGGKPFTSGLTLIPDRMRQFNLRVGIASGAWKTVADLPMPGDIQRNVSETASFLGDMQVVLHDKPSLNYSTQSGVARKVFFVSASRDLDNLALRITAVDRFGKVHVLNITGNGPVDSPVASSYMALSLSDSGPLHHYNQFDMGAIRAFRLEARPYEWTLFQGIQFQPTN